MWARAIVVGIASALLTSFIGWSVWIPDALSFHAMWLAVIGAIYVGFGFSDGRVSLAAVELLVATVFLVLAFLGLWLAPGFIAAGLVLHGLWDLAHHPRGVRTKLPAWYPPFCAAFDFVFAGVFLAFASELAVRT
ncbi:MAG TPA: DUF6010 family protein [Vicinamibacteria bacterium]|nr:DUF6010 family protein [Vicinamibacteria bacterium]